MVVFAGQDSARHEIPVQCALLDKEAALIPAAEDPPSCAGFPAPVGDQPLLGLPRPSLSIWQEAVKRSFDLVISSLLLLLTSPLMLLLHILVRLDHPGPALYRQQRVGKGGRLYTILKFRTMVNDAEAATGPVTAGPNDPRITSLGAVLRKMHLDELPQLLNVLRGEMSLVGPRPERLKFVEQFLREMPAYRLRLHVRPGITGLAQIKGTYSTEPGKKLRFDLLYICRYSVAFDVGILIETFLGLLGLLFWSAPAAVEAKDEPLRNFQVSDSRT